MRKHETLRAILVKNNPEFETDPTRLTMYMRSGGVAAPWSENLDYEMAFQLFVEVRGFSGNSGLIFAPIVDWLRSHQPDLLLNPDKAKRAFRFEIDVLDDRTVDIDIVLDLTEGFDVARDGEGYTVVARTTLVPTDYALTDPAVNLQQIFDAHGMLLPKSEA